MGLRARGGQDDRGEQSRLVGVGRAGVRVADDQHQVLGAADRQSLPVEGHPADLRVATGRGILAKRAANAERMRVRVAGDVRVDHFSWARRAPAEVADPIGRWLTRIAKP